METDTVKNPHGAFASLCCFPIIIIFLLSCPQQGSYLRLHLFGLTPLGRPVGKYQRQYGLV
jgi:hypothetical protein